jgi:choline-sulfatase
MVKPGRERSASSGAKRPENLIFIMMDTARADAFAAFGPGTAHTPAFDAFVPEATAFANAYNNENWTKPSVATMLSGLYPSSHDTKRDDSKLPAAVELLSQRLKAEKFATAGFIANGYISKHFGFKKGWDAYRNYIREGAPCEAEHVYGDALAWLDEHRSERFFLYIQTIDPHVPYAVDREYTKRAFPEEYTGFLGADIDAEEARLMSTGEKKPSQNDIDWLRAVYYGEISYHDEHMGRFLDQVRAWGLMKNTLIVINNDHGEELYEYGKIGHGHSLYEHMIRSALVIRFPPLFPSGLRVDEIVEHVDLAPTILDALGLKPLGEADGTSLLPLVHGKPHRRPYYAIIEFLARRRAVRVGDWKLMRSTDDWLHLYNVVADPEERNDRITDSPIARRLCEVHLGEGLGMPVKRERLQDLTTRRQLKATKVKIGPRTRRGLEALGYFGDH